MVMNDKEEKEFKQKLDEVLATLDYLNDRFNLQYIFHCLKIVDNVYTINHMYHNSDIDIVELEYSIGQILLAQKNMGYLNSVLGSGRTVVLCEDDSQKPNTFEGDWVEKGKIYNVVLLRKTNEGFFYELEGIKNNTPGFHSRRFKRLSSVHQFN